MKTLEITDTQASIGLYTRILQRCNQRGLPDNVTYILANRASQRQQEARADLHHLRQAQAMQKH